MKTVLAIVFSLAITSSLFAQQEISRDASGNKIIRGFITRQELATDTAFKWFAENSKGFTPNAAAVASFQAAKDSVHVLVFGGTWCGDTKHILPQFYALTDAAGFPQDHITLVGVDRNKKTIQHLSEAFGVLNVPTFIVLKNGKEIGRVVEYGKYGMVDKELGEIVSKK